MPLGIRVARGLSCPNLVFVRPCMSGFADVEKAIAEYGRKAKEVSLPAVCARRVVRFSR